jgi:HlyD family secretion protein
MKSHKIRRLMTIIIPLVAVAAAIIYLLNTSGETNSSLHGSGTVEAENVIVASELSGRIVEVYFDEGDSIQSGDVLFQLDDALYQAQRKLALASYQSAEANVSSAQTAVDTAQASLDSAQLTVQAAQLQYDITLAAARLEERSTRITAWTQTIPTEFDLPVWYFQKNETLDAAEAEVKTAKDDLAIEKKNLDDTLDNVTNGDIREAEKRLQDARAAFIIAQDLLNRAKQQSDQDLRDTAQTSFDTSKQELETAQNAYDEMLSDEEEEKILEARARLTLAQARYDSSLDRVNSLRTGEQSLKVEAADTSVEQAQAGVKLAQAQLAQAQANLDHANKVLDQAQAQIDLNDIQIQKLTVTSATSGIVRSRNIEPGEVLQPGAVAMTIDRIDTLMITVYIPEDRYGQIGLGDYAQVTVDSFPGEIFDAIVTRIADRAEFTPRNVQTEEGRRTTVFAVDLSVQNSDAKLKPGMPADVVFNDQ